jgi:hypothetical protein
MNDNYIIVLFKNKVKKKIINKFKTNKKAVHQYESLVKESDNTKFYKKYENGVESNYELALLELGSKNWDNMYMKDEFGRQIKIELEDSDYRIIKINRFYPEEYILDYEKKKKLSLNEFMKKHLTSGYKMISKLNNKIVLQEDDNFKLFTLKNVYDSDRFIDTLSDILIKEKRSNVLLVKDVSTAQRKYLYNLLVGKGYPKSYLLRYSTTHLQ